MSDEIKPSPRDALATHLAVALRGLMHGWLGPLNREQAIACMFIAVEQFKESNGNRALWLDIAARVFDMTKPAPGAPVVEPGDVIQLSPDQSPWGPLLCVVDEVRDWGVTCYWIGATERGKPPAYYPYRAKLGAFVVVGKAEWTAQIALPT